MYDQMIQNDYTKCTKLLGKLHKILSTIDYIEKDARNQNANYNYASEKAIKIALHEAFNKVGVMMFPHIIESEVKDIQPGMDKEGKAKPTMVTVSKAVCDLVDVDSGEKLSLLMMGCGNGRDDKGLYASITGIIKYTLTSVFLIPTGDDAEADEDRKPTFLPPKEDKKAPVQKPTQEADKAPATKEPAKEQPKAQEKAPEVPKPAPVAPVPAPEEPKDAPKEKRADFGNPTAGEKTISAAEVAKVGTAMSRYGISTAELEAKAGYPLAQFSDGMLKNLRTDYAALKEGRCTKEQFLSSECVCVDYPPKGA